MKTSSVVGGLALAALAFSLGFWMGGRPAHVEGGDPPARLATILRMSDHNARAHALADFFADADPGDVEDLLKVMRGDRQHVDEVAEILFAAWWAGFDPQGALEGRMLANWAGRHPWIRTVVKEWGRREPEPARLAVAKMDKNQVEPHQVAVASLIRAWFENDGLDPEPLVDIIETLDLVKARGDAINVFLNTMMDTRGVPATEQFVENMAERSYGFKTEFFGRFVGNNTLRDPAYAYAWALKHADGPHGANLLRHLSARWGYEDGPAAMEWALALPSSDQKSFLIERTWRSFLLRDRGAARAWMGEQEFRPELESAYALYLIGTAKQDPEAAIALAARVEDQQRRNKVLKAAGRAWMKSDAAAAKAWLEGPEVPREVREGVLNPPRRVANRPAPAKTKSGK